MFVELSEITIDVEEFAIYTITLKLRQVITRRFYKLDEDFSVKGYLASKKYKVSEQELESLENKVFKEWLELSDQKKQEIQNKLLLKIADTPEQSK